MRSPLSEDGRIWPTLGVFLPWIWQPLRCGWKKLDSQMVMNPMVQSVKKVTKKKNPSYLKNTVFLQQSIFGDSSKKKLETRPPPPSLLARFILECLETRNTPLNRCCYCSSKIHVISHVFRMEWSNRRSFVNGHPIDGYRNLQLTMVNSSNIPHVTTLEVKATCTLYSKYHPNCNYQVTHKTKQQHGHSKCIKTYKTMMF